MPQPLYVIILRHEDNSLVTLDQNGAGEVPTHRSRQHQSLQVAAFADHVRHRVAVADASNVLSGSEEDAGFSLL